MSKPRQRPELVRSSLAEKSATSLLIPYVIGCGGCVPLVTNIFKAEMKKAGKATNNNICAHFAMSRADLFNVVK
jgi:hypothetical protein